MEKTLTEICEYLNNFFWRQKRAGTIKIVNGTFSADYLKEGQYFRILGSDLNDGVYIYPATDLKDETFEGYIWSMAVPQAVIDLASDIEAWQAKYGSVDSIAMSPYSSENFGNYGYGKEVGGVDDSGNSKNSWKSIFASRLVPYKRLRGLP